MLGFALTTLAVLELSDALGDQLYVLAPLAVRVAEDPEQIVKLGVNVMVGVVTTVIGTVQDNAEQSLVVTVKVPF